MGDHRLSSREGGASRVVGDSAAADERAAIGQYKARSGSLIAIDEGIPENEMTSVNGNRSIGVTGIDRMATDDAAIQGHSRSICPERRAVVIKDPAVPHEQLDIDASV